MPANEHSVGRTGDLEDGQMKEVVVGDTKVLLARVNGEYYALGAECPHWGAPLAEGLLCGERLICPWHKSCFRVSDGALLEPPALDGLPRYSVRVENGTIFVSVPDSAPEPPKPSGRLKSSDSRRMVILGAGAAGLVAAEALRFAGYEGRIEMISHEGELPYDRPKLSKGYLSGQAKGEELPLRPRDFYEEYGIEHVVRRVTEVDVAQRQILFDDGPPVTYTALLLATGGRPRTLDCPGANLRNIFLLRSEADADHILSAASEGTRAVVVGGSFIGMEAVSCFAARKIPVTVVVKENVPFANQFGPEVGHAFRVLAERNDVEFRLNSEVERFDGAGAIREVMLRSGERLSADIVVIGVGVRPATEFIRGVQTREDGGIVVDQYLRAAPDVYAAGDIAVFPEQRSLRPIRIEHWRVAEQQGRVAAGNMLGRAKPFEAVPYFWTEQFGTPFEYLGHAEDWDDFIIQGDVNKPEFLGFYVKDGRVAAAVASGRDRDMAALHELMRLNRVPAVEEIRREVDLVKLAQESARVVSA
ncbi:MAG: FAD-dependent oxidoreductase [Acidobacteriaceae bacterium]|nr:FAD-dependent oxidoreductase [Acidobacteriaceae bacterium]MBV9779148.1 FAD-dependent oxidoreductase [Acidobacteriaceae bacterium]